MVTYPRLITQSSTYGEGRREQPKKNQQTRN